MDNEVITEESIRRIDERKAEEYIEAGENFKALVIYKRLAMKSDEYSDKIQDLLNKIQAETKPKEQKESIFRNSSIRFKDVIGMKRPKKLMYKMIGLPIKHQKILDSFRINPTTGIIIYGGAGTGKTLLIQAMAGEMNLKYADIHISEVLSKFVGEGEKKIKEIFEEAKKNQPCILFFDEFDALGKSRDAISSEGTGAELRTLITTLLKEITELYEAKAQVFLVGATNQPWNIDIALKRAGRFEYNIYIPPPNLMERQQLFKLYLKVNEPKNAQRINYGRLALSTTFFSPADIARICKTAKLNVLEKEKHLEDKTITTGDVIKILKSKEYGKSSLDEWYDTIKDVYIGNQKSVIIKEGKYKYKKKIGNEGKFTLGERQAYKELINDVQKYQRFKTLIALSRMIPVWMWV